MSATKVINPILSGSDWPFVIVGRKGDDSPQLLMWNKKHCEKMMEWLLEDMKNWGLFSENEFQLLAEEIGHMRNGTCHVFVQRCWLRWQSRTSQCYGGEEILCQPVVLQNKNAATLKNAIDSAVDELSLEKLQILARHVCLVWVLLNFDKAAANIRT